MSQNSEQNEPMPAASYDDHIRKWIDAVERRTMARDGINKPEARRALANRLGVSYWTLANLLRGRVKGVRGDLRGRIKDGIILGLNKEISELEHELAMVSKCHVDSDDVEINEIQEALNKVRAMLRKGQAS